jgi:site-specific recombinase XerD
LDQARARFKQYLKRRFGQSNTPKLYISDLNIFIRTLGNNNKTPEAVTPEDIDAFADGQIAAGLSPTTVNRRLASLHSFFEFLADERPERDWPNPVVGRRHYLKTGSRLPRDVSDIDVARLFAVISDERDRAVFSLMVGAGLRVGEVAVLRMDSIEAPTRPGRFATLRVLGKGHKERIIWLTETLWDALQAWLRVRPQVEADFLFLNHRGRPIGVGGIQYRLKQHCQAAGLTLSCHQLRHTFARRLAENGLPVDSLAKLLGHNQLQTTQRYIDGADPTVWADFAMAMARLETNLIRDQRTPLASPKLSPPSQPRTAPQNELSQLRQRLDCLPFWLGEAVDAYFSWRWPTWRVQTAYQLGLNFISVIRRIWIWLATHRQIEGWQTLRRADLEAWLQARSGSGVSVVTLQNDLGQLRSLLKFLEARDCPLDPGLFRVKAPKKGSQALPRYLPETDYRRLENTILQATQIDTYHACFDQAWFLTLAQPGLRVSELLDLRLSDLSLMAGYATVRDGKHGRDRVVYLTPALVNALRRYLNQRPEQPDDHVFLLHGRSPTARTIQRRLTHYGQEAGVQVSPHQLRHTFATRLINQGIPIHSLQRLLGHQHLNTTQIYARIYDETLYTQFKGAMSRLEAIAVDDWPRVERSKPVLKEL